MTDAILAGASGYVVKEIQGLDLLSAIRTVRAGSSLLDSRAATAVRDRLRATDRSAKLSEQERGVLGADRSGIVDDGHVGRCPSVNSAHS